MLKTVVVLVFLCISNSLQGPNSWRWKCEKETNLCKRFSADGNNDGSENVNSYPSIEVCRLVCGNYAGLWPQPINCTINPELTTFSISSLSFILNAPTEETRVYLKQIVDIFANSKINTNCPSEYPSRQVSVQIRVSQATTQLIWNTTESYRLDVEPSQISISSTTIFGARHALETLGQLVELYTYPNGTTCYVIVKQATITDAPTFTHRGLLLDTSRNFLHLETIRKHVDALSSVKMNVLHWHISDSQSFPLALPSQPKMAAYGSYSPQQVYTTNQIAELAAYARLRGVRILIEIDGPSHSGYGWQWGPEDNLGNLTVCLNGQPWRSFCVQPPCGQMNPANQNIYKVLGDIFSDLLKVVGESETLHMGGDEVHIPCWNSTPEIIRYLRNKPRTEATFLDLWGEYQKKVLEAFDRSGGAGKYTIVWSSSLTEPGVIETHLPKDRFVIQTWVGENDRLPVNLLNLGYKLILSTKDRWYLDHGFWGKTPYYDWPTVYNNKMLLHPGVLGGEVCMWGERVDDNGVDTRVWPRAAAAAERLWTNPRRPQWTEQRFYRQRERLLGLGLKVDAVAPKWCLQNEGECY